MRPCSKQHANKHTQTEIVGQHVTTILTSYDVLKDQLREKEVGVEVLVSRRVCIKGMLNTAQTARQCMLGKMLIACAIAISRTRATGL
jgi:hypothetical protein